MSAAAHNATDEAVYVQRMALGGDGLRVGIKDSIDVAGYPTRLGSAALAAAAPAAHHAAVVQALLDAGCRIVGKTNMHELAYGVTGINRWSGTPRNPRYPDRIPGGSSSGSAAAVAAGLPDQPHRTEAPDFAIGTDTGGSIRIPATCCGVFGLKPTYGRVSRDGVHPERSSLDCVGPFARSLDLLERAMALIDPSWRASPRPDDIRLGVVNVSAAAAVDEAVGAALSRTDAVIVPIDLPSFDDAFAAGLAIIGREIYAAFGHLIEHPGLGADVRARLLTARDISDDALGAAEACRLRFRAEVDAALQRVDALALPTLPDVPPRLGETGDARAVLRMTAFVRVFNLSGHPALCLPLATQTDTPGPAGLQLVGGRGGDAELCALAQRLAESWPDAG